MCPFCSPPIGDVSTKGPPVCLRYRWSLYRGWNSQHGNHYYEGTVVFHRLFCVFLWQNFLNLIPFWLAFSFFHSGAEMEPESTDFHRLAQCLHAGGLPEGHGRAAPAQIPPGDFHADRTGASLFNSLFHLKVWGVISCEPLRLDHSKRWIRVPNINWSHRPVLITLMSLFPSCWICACSMYGALSFPTASWLLRPCFTSRLWTWWKMSQVKTTERLFETGEGGCCFLLALPDPSVVDRLQLWRGQSWRSVWGGWFLSPWRCARSAAPPWKRSRGSLQTTRTTSRPTLPTWHGWWVQSSPSTNFWYKNVSKVSVDIEANPRWNHWTFS